MKVIPTFVHGVADYSLGIVLILAPNLFGFSDVGGAAVVIPRFLGILTLGQALLTDYELGVIRRLPMRAHLTMDYVMSIFLLVSPWLFGFSRQPSHVWMPHVIVGIIAFLTALMTQSAPAPRAIHQAQH